MVKHGNDDDSSSKRPEENRAPEADRSAHKILPFPSPKSDPAAKSEAEPPRPARRVPGSAPPREAPPAPSTLDNELTRRLSARFGGAILEATLDRGQSIVLIDSRTVSEIALSLPGRREVRNASRSDRSGLAEAREALRCGLEFVFLREERAPAAESARCGGRVRSERDGNLGGERIGSSASASIFSASHSKGIPICAASCCPKSGRAIRCARTMTFCSKTPSGCAKTWASRAANEYRLRIGGIRDAARHRHDRPWRRRNHPEHGAAAPFNARRVAREAAAGWRTRGRFGMHHRLSASRRGENRGASQLPSNLRHTWTGWITWRRFRTGWATARRWRNCWEPKRRCARAWCVRFSPSCSASQATCCGWARTRWTSAR